MTGSTPSATNAASVRIDRWLCAARIYKSRTQAQEACDGGHVRINDHPARSSQPVKVGDVVRCQAPRGLVILEVKKLADKRLSPPLARELYEDHSPPPPPKEERIPIGFRERGAGRPTKADRRALERLRRDYD
jgi:ribosome-associated heat shock protein Hsp15